MCAWSNLLILMLKWGKIVIKAETNWHDIPLLCLRLREDVWVNYFRSEGFSHISRILIASSSATELFKTSKYVQSFHLSSEALWWRALILHSDRVVCHEVWVYKPQAPASTWIAVENRFVILNLKENLRTWEPYKLLGGIRLDCFLYPKHLWCAGQEAPGQWPAPTTIWAPAALAVSQTNVTLGGLLRP